MTNTPPHVTDINRQQPPESPHQARVADSPPLPDSYEPREAAVNFAQPVADNGYLWWYVDAISDDGQQSITMIIFVGSVFSPYYAKARSRGPQPAENHCAFNTILYGPGNRKRWSMTERSGAQLERSAHSYRLGPSKIDWDGESFIAHIDERCVPMPRKMRGSVRITPSAITGHSLRLDEGGRHYWNPIAPIARVDVDFPALGVRWSGDGYMDSNHGAEALAEGFSGWDWTRARLSNGDCAVRYEARHPQRETHRLALRFSEDGSISSEPTGLPAVLPTTGIWRVERQMPGAEGTPRILRTLEDTPFYARSLVDASFDGASGIGFHESLSMLRFQRPWVQTLLPFRMPRLR